MTGLTRREVVLGAVLVGLCSLHGWILPGPGPDQDGANPLSDCAFFGSFVTVQVAARELGPGVPLLAMVTEVTQGQFLTVMERNPSPHYSESGQDIYGTQLPVVNITPREAEQFADALTLREASAGCDAPGRGRWRLPTEREWLWLAGPPPEGSVCEFENVGDYRLGAAAPLMATYPCDDGFAGPSPVASKRANSRGMYDMGGNVSEILASDPQEESVSRRTFRGGSWATYFSPSGPWAERSTVPVSGRGFEDVGFRLVRDAR